jgi:hypothetical protein
VTVLESDSNLEFVYPAGTGGVAKNMMITVDNLSSNTFAGYVYARMSMYYCLIVCLNLKPSH